MALPSPALHLPGAFVSLDFDGKSPWRWTPVPQWPDDEAEMETFKGISQIFIKIELRPFFTFLRFNTPFFKVFVVFPSSLASQIYLFFIYFLYYFSRRYQIHLAASVHGMIRLYTSIPHEFYYVNVIIENAVVSILFDAVCDWKMKFLSIFSNITILTWSKYFRNKVVSVSTIFII